jgi:hypothetical protein
VFLSSEQNPFPPLMVSKMLAEDTRKENGQAPVARDVIYMIVAAPRKTPRPPDLPRPMECRPEGSRPQLVINLISDVPRGVDVALGRVPQRNAADFVRANGVTISGAIAGGSTAGPALGFAGTSSEVFTANFGASAFSGSVPSV